MRTIAFIGKTSKDCYPYNWCKNAVELGYSAKLNDIGGLGKDDVIIIDKKTMMDVSSSPAKKILLFPDLISTTTVQSEYLRTRAQLVWFMHKKVDIIAMPPNLDNIALVEQLTGKPTFPIVFGAYTQYLSYFPRRYPRKTIELGYCWSPGSEHRQKIALDLRAQRIEGFGADMIRGLSQCRFGLNAHYTPLLNLEQRMTEIPIAGTIPVSEKLSCPELIKDIHWIPIEEYKPNMLTRKEYISIVVNNIKAVRDKYNSKESLKMLLSLLKK